jgi:hypothetical protein
LALFPLSAGAQRGRLFLLLHEQRSMKQNQPVVSRCVMDCRCGNEKLKGGR